MMVIKSNEKNVGFMNNISYDLKCMISYALETLLGIV